MLVRDLLAEKRARLDLSDPFDKILRAFLKEEAGILPVYREGQLMGVLRQADVLEALWKGTKPGTRQLLRDEPRKYLREDTPVEGIRQMEDYLLVTGGHGEKLGVLLPLDLARALPASIRKSSSRGQGEGVPGPPLSLRESLERYEKALLRDALQECGSTYEMAEKLGVNQSTVVRKLKKYNIIREASRRGGAGKGG